MEKIREKKVMRSKSDKSPNQPTARIREAGVFTSRDVQQSHSDKAKKKHTDDLSFGSE